MFKPIIGRDFAEFFLEKEIFEVFFMREKSYIFFVSLDCIQKKILGKEKFRKII